ncbi:hypothetical protein [Nesterenkonia pannonica]|uniref:hypothetical protein n=1 Tax=Nesterenkonia pannonica TaxID=1548602 RepID=UPI00216433A3|nr:hypothetical protein [Nesterenkonia pannonica]
MAGSRDGVVILASSQLLYAFESQTNYGTALYEAALATVTGTGITTEDPLSKAVQLVLAVYSVGVFATLAYSLGRSTFAANSHRTSPRRLVNRVLSKVVTIPASLCGAREEAQLWNKSLRSSLKDPRSRLSATPLTWRSSSTHKGWTLPHL